MRQRNNAKRGYWDRDSFLKTKSFQGQCMDKQKLRIILGQLIALANLFKGMETEGFDWEKQSEYLNLLQEIIADLERVIDD